MKISQGNLFSEGEHNGRVKIRPYTKKDLCQLYGISHKVLGLWLKPFAGDTGPLIGRYFSSAQVKLIFEKLGMPPEPDG